MNERIQELAKQAGFHFDEYNEVTRRKVETFAELIAAEAISCCEKNYVGAIGTPASAHNTAVNRCVANIKANFGIE